MESISALENLEENISKINSYANEYNDFMSKKKIDNIEKTIVEIKETFKIDYTIPLKMTKKEEQELRKLGIRQFYPRNKKKAFALQYR